MLNANARKNFTACGDVKAEELLEKVHVDGGLIGGAALKADSFAKLITEAIGR